MKLNEFRQIIREAIKEYQANNPQKSPSPSKPGPGIAPSPGKTPTREPGKNPGRLNPGQAPKTRPKAVYNENEKQIVDKISKRYKNIKNG